MPGFFDALKDFKPTPPKKHYVTIDGNKIEVPLQKHIEIQRVGIENYEYKNNEIVRKWAAKMKVDRLFDGVKNKETLIPKLCNLYKLNKENIAYIGCLLYTSPSPRDQRGSRMPSSA